MTTGPNAGDGVLQGRAPWFLPDDLDGEARELYDSITAGPRGATATRPDGRLTGPFNAMLLSPRVGNALQGLGAAIRFFSGLEDRSRELATLEAARAARSDFEWNAHAQLGRAAGLTEDEIAAVLEGRARIATLSASETAVREVVLELIARGDLDDDGFAAAVDALGTRTVMELIVLVGYYNLLATSMRVWRVPLNEGQREVFSS